MFLDEKGITLDDFEGRVLEALDGFQKVVAAMNETGARVAAPEHFLMALLRVPDGPLADAMRRDRDDRHSRVERGWTPPPKGYTSDFEPGAGAGEAAPAAGRASAED